MKQKTKRTLSGVGAVVVALALLIGGTYAYTAFEHKSNPFRNAPDYQGRLVEDFEEKEWEPEVAIRKHISVRNVGGTQDFPGNRWGDIYARVKLKEHMDISPIDYDYYPKANATEKVRFMVDKQGRFVKFEATTATLGSAELDAIKAHSIWNEVINDGQQRDAFLASLTAGNFIRLSGYFDEGVYYWYLRTKANDPNGQYGAFVVIERIVDYTRMDKITGSERASGMDYGTGILIRDPSEHDNEECLYPVHYWDDIEPWDCNLRSHDYVTWLLGDSRTAGDDWVLVDDWDGQAVAKWILNPVTGWATWGQAIPPTQSTALLLESITPIRMPDGEFLYVIHADMQCTDRFDMLKPGFWKDGDGEDDPWDIEGIVGEKDTPVSSVSIDGGDRTMEIGDEDQLTARVRPTGATNKNVRWRSSDPSVVTVDDDGNITAVGEGTAVITVTTEDGDLEDEITITVVPGAIPATGATIDVGAQGITIEVGQELNIPHTITPSNTTDTPVWTSNNGNVAIVNQNGRIRGAAVGTSVVTLTVGGKTATVTVNVVPATIPATGVNITTASPMTIEVGQTLPIAYTVTPTNTTDTATLTSNNANVSIVSPTQIKGEAVGTSIVTVRLNATVSATINVTVVAPTPDTLTIDVGAAGITITQGEEMNIPHTILPPNTNYVPVWTSNNGNVTIVNQNGRIRGAAVGTSVVTLTVGGKTATVNVTVIPAEDPQLPLLGSGTYQMQGHDDPNLNYALTVKLDAYDYNRPIVVQPGTIKLSDVLSSNVAGLSVTSSDAAVASKVSIGTDHKGAAAIVITYYGPQSAWEAVKPAVPNNMQITLTLSAPGYQDANINVIMAFNGSLYQYD